MGEDEIFDPRCRLSPDEADELAQIHVEPQALEGATLLTAPAYYDSEPLGDTRDTNLALTHAASAYVARRALRAPAPDDEWNLARAFHGTILVPCVTLTSAVIGELIAMYREADVDGFFIWAVNFSGSAQQYRLLRELALGLQERTGLPVTLGGVGHLWKAGLANGLAATCFGHQNTMFKWPPEDVDPKRQGLHGESEKSRGFGFPVYHRAVLAGFRVGKPGEAERRRAFFAHPCECGHHISHEPPSGQPVVLAHNTWSAMWEARLACAGEPGLATAGMVQRVERAVDNRRRFGMGELPRAWQGVDFEAAEAASSG